VKSSQAVYIIGGASVVSTCVLWGYSIWEWSGVSTSAKLSLSSTLAGSSLAFAGIILVLLGLALGMRDPALFGHKFYARSLILFFTLVPLSLISSYAATIFGLVEQEPFFLLSLSTLFLMGILLLIGTTVLVGRQV
jgi:hypothetical protein